ncbi:sulfhydryl oxidase 1 [Brienomyrus brachyistius]|uniref:sulfhydryl oxidase 1 n=1 Tax=Brienomyrus brachyistius TaxID=42636 RepID=UPI0020B1E144|nr:sulfhydryl oxidase 1 [Brienomyrus brachyistius]
MAQYRRCAASPLTARSVFKHRLFCILVFSAFLSSAETGLYSQSDQIVLLNPNNVDSVLFNSSAALVVEFYASWCGHCVAFSPVWKNLAMDTKEWKPAVDLVAIDCAAEENRKTCIHFGIRGYPTVKFFHAYSEKDSTGTSFPVHTQDMSQLRRQMISMIEKHKEHWPPACPPLEAASKAEIDSLLESSGVEHLALVFETASSYVGREVILDLLQFDNIAVRRVLNTEEELVSKMSVTDFPSCHLYHQGGNSSRLNVPFEARTFYSYALQRLPRVVRTSRPKPVTLDLIRNTTEHSWREFNRTNVYMSDLESALHLSLRVELASHATISKGALTALKRYVSVLAKYFPGRPVVRKLLQTANAWLNGLQASELQYSSFLEVLDNATEDAVLPRGESWVGCQGSQPHFRKYPCSLWTLFHVLTVAANSASDSRPQEVLQAMRAYVKRFFGCQECASHFEGMAQEGMVQVSTQSEAVLWLWSRHNRVNNRLAGDLSEDPNFPKIQWPPPELCPKCHGIDNGEHSWQEAEVLSFLMDYYSSSKILDNYLQDVRPQKAGRAQGTEDRAARAGRDTRGRMEAEARDEPTSETEEDKEEEEEEVLVEGEQEPGMDRLAGGREGEEAAALEPPPSWEKEWEHRPSIVGLRPREPQEAIVDLDSFVSQLYKAKGLRSSRKKRALRAHRPAPEVALLPVEPDDLPGEQRRLQKRGLTGRYVELGGEGRRGPRRPWISALALGFSRLDVSLCALLYVLSSLCLLAMYRCSKVRGRPYRGKLVLP